MSNPFASRLSAFIVNYIEAGGSTIEVNRICSCGLIQRFNLDHWRYQNWKEGEFFIQQAFPKMKEDDRETLISGLCPKCFGDHMCKD